MKHLLHRYLYLLARVLIRRYRPKVVAITGSIGKTTTKDMIAAVLGDRFRVRASMKSYNNEIGLPLTVLGAKSANRSLVGWVFVGIGAWYTTVFHHRIYPNVLVLEMGADHPGDLGYLTSVAPPDIAVLTAVTSAHLEYFGTLEKVADEKRTIVRNLRQHGVAVLNADDSFSVKTTVPEGRRAVTYGMRDDATVRGSDVINHFEHNEKTGVMTGGVSFKVTHAGATVPIHLPGSLGQPAVSSALAATAVALELGMHLVEISEALKNYQGTPGRLRLLAGVKGTTIVDDSYNASPTAVLAALDVLKSVPREKKQWRWATLGDMAELGRDTEHGHEVVGERLAELAIDGLITVGERARTIAQAARRAGMDPRNIYSFANSHAAGSFLQERLEPGDVVLVKGSQIMRMERIVLQILADPKRAPELLVRQESEWQ